VATCDWITEFPLLPQVPRVLVAWRLQISYSIVHHLPHVISGMVETNPFLLKSKKVTDENEDQEFYFIFIF
jgi:hypothetical protein